MSIGKNSISRANKANQQKSRESTQKFYDACDIEEPKIKAESVRVDIVPTSLIISSFDEESVTVSDAFNKVVASVKNFGILIPLLLREVTVNGEKCYRILSGHKRLYAAKLLGISCVPAEIIVCDDRKAAAIYNEIEKYDSQSSNLKVKYSVSDDFAKDSDLPSYLL